jgi:hypothetical protein
MIKLHYFRLYSAPGIYDFNPDADEELLRNDKVVVRILGSHSFQSVLDDFLISPGKSFDALNEIEKKNLQVRRNSYLAYSSSHAIFYVNAGLFLNDLDLQSIQGVEGPVWDKLPHESIAKIAFDSVAAAVSLSRVPDASRNFEFILDGYYATDPTGDGFQRFSRNRVSDGYVTATISKAEISQATTLAAVLYKETEMRTVIDLFSAALTPRESGHLHAFISAWTGLEIFVAKQFRELEPSIEIIVKGLSTHETFSDRMRVVMRDKYRLTDKFAVISNYYNEIDADDDMASFKRIKDARDGFFHTMKGDMNSLPLDETRTLLEKYLKLYQARNKRAG